MQTLPIARQLAAIALIVGSAAPAQAFSLPPSGKLSFNSDVDAEIRFVPLAADDYLASVSMSPYLVAKDFRSQGFSVANPVQLQMPISQWAQRYPSNARTGTFSSLAANSGSGLKSDIATVLALGLGIVGWMSYRSRAV